MYYYADWIVGVPLMDRRVSAGVAVTGRSGDKSIGRFDGREQVSIRALAEVAVLAGCRPDYMPLLVAAMEIMLADNFPASLLLESKGGYFPYVIVNGPIRQAIDLNCRPNLFGPRSEEHTSELKSLMRISYAVFCVKKKKNTNKHQHHNKKHEQNYQYRQHIMIREYEKCMDEKRDHISTHELTKHKQT